MVVSCDTNPPPRMVEKIAATFSSRLEAPREDFLRKEKNIMTRDFSGEKLFRNRHERDALASALYGWARVKNLVARIERRLRESGIEDEAEGNLVKTDVILNRISIDRSIKKI